MFLIMQMKNSLKKKACLIELKIWLKWLRLGGESMKSCFTYNEIQTMLEESGLLIYEHLTPDEIQEHFFKNRTDYLSCI